MNTSSPLALIQRNLTRLRPPKGFFSGARIEDSFAPDNIILFQRTDTSGYQPRGVTNNYHHRFELVNVIEKGGPVRIGSQTCELQPGETALIFPNQFHHYMDVDPGPLSWLFVTFELPHANSIHSLQNSPRVLDAAAVERLGELLEIYTRPGSADGLLLSFTLANLLRHLTELPSIADNRRNLHATDDVRDVILEKINHYVRERLDRSVTIGDLARDLGYSISHLRAVFRDRLGVSLGRYIRESRLAEAASLLHSTPHKITAIGEKCGFESLYAFSRAFRKSYGFAPRAYRQLVRHGRQIEVTPSAGHGGDGA